MKKLLTLLAVASLMLSTLLTAVPVHAQPTIDGTLEPGEWDAYYLGTSVTAWEGGMSVEVYGFADDSYLYVAYKVDIPNSPGFATSLMLGIEFNFYFKTPQAITYPAPGYTLLAGSGWPDWVCQTDGSDFAGKGTFDANGIEYGYSTNWWDPIKGQAEFKIPLSLITYAGTDGIIEISGQYWQFAFATPFCVSIPPTEVEIDIKPSSYPNSINLKSKGVVPVAVLGSSIFDVSTVDPTTALFATASPVRWTMEDVNNDGYMDMLFFFKMQDLDLVAGSTEATLTGATLIGWPIEGTDTVNIVPT